MKNTGIVRRIDELGRLVVPMELRNKLEINERDELEIYIEGTSIILKKCQHDCIFCGSTKNLTEYKDKKICAKCANAIAQNIEKKEN